MSWNEINEHARKTAEVSLTVKVKSILSCLLINQSTGFSDGCKSYDMIFDWTGVLEVALPPASLKHQLLFGKMLVIQSARAVCAKKLIKQHMLLFSPFIFSTRAVFLSGVGEKATGLSS